MEVTDLTALDPTLQDFIGIIKVYYDKLTNKETITILMNQLQTEVPLNSHEGELTEYRMHLPIDLCKYVKLLECKFLELPKENLQSLDGSYKTYLITFFFFCIKRGGTVTDKTKVTVSNLYLKLTMLPEVGKLFFSRDLYLYIMLASIEITRSPDIDRQQKVAFIKLVKRHCLQEDHLDNELLAASTNVIVTSMIIAGSKQMIQDEMVTGLSACCMKSLHIIILHTSNLNIVRVVARRLFRCIKQRYLDLIPNKDIAVDIIILFIKRMFQIRAFDRKIEVMLEAFSDNWASEEFTNFKAAIKIMNVLREDHYKNLLRKMAVCTEPKNHKTLLINVFKLIHGILVTPPNFCFNKISVLYSCLVFNMMHHILNADKEVASTAIDVLKEICNPNTNPLHQYIFAEVRSSGKLVNMTIESVILGLSYAADQNWSTKNKKLFEIFSRFVALTPELNPAMVQKALNGIIKDAEPATFDSSLAALQMSFLAASERNETEVAQLLLQVIHKFAFSTANKKSLIYASHIFNAMLHTSEVDGKTYSPKYYYRIYLSSDFNYEALFTKCKHLIGEREVRLCIKNLDYLEPGSSILLNCLLDHCQYTNISVLVPYIIKNFVDLSKNVSSGYVCSALESILKNESVSDIHHPQLDAIQNAIMVGLLEKKFPLQSIRPVYSLYETIRRILKLPKDERQLDELLAHSVMEVCQQLYEKDAGDNSTILYLNEICLVLQKVPNDGFFVTIQNCLEDPMRLKVVTTLIPDIELQILTLLCTIAMMKKSKIPIVLRYLRQYLENEDIITKVLAVKLLYSLCKEMTHEFEDIIKFSFQEMIVGNPCLVKICASILDELIHEDYIKLTSEEFYIFVYTLGCHELKTYMKSVLMKTFVLSNQNDITKYYLQTIMYVHVYGKFSDYPIASNFYDSLTRMKLKVDAPREILKFFFIKLPINRKFDIIMEITTIFEDIIKGQCKADEAFFDVLLDLLATIKFMKTGSDDSMSKDYYQNVIKMVDKQIVHYDPNCKLEQYYIEYKNEIKKCTLALLKTLFFESEQLAEKIQVSLFDTLIHWVDFVKAEIVHYTHQEKGKDCCPYFAKLVQYYKKNKQKFDNVAR